MPYKFESVVAPGAGKGTWLGGINDDGTAVGYYAGAGGGGDPYDHAFTYANGQLSPFELTDPRPNTTANGINTDGQVVGQHGTDPTGEIGYVLSSDGSEQYISDNPHHRSGIHDTAHGINDSGQVVGTHTTPAGVHFGFVWQDGNMSIIQVPGATNTEARGINNQGVTVGSADNYGFIDVNNKFYLLGINGAKVVDPMAINNFNTVVGSYEDNSNHWHGWIDQGGRLSFINAPGATDTWVTGINDNGTVVGYSDTSSGGPTQGFIGTKTAADPIATMVREEWVAGLGHDADQGSIDFWTSVLKAGLLTTRDFVQDLTATSDFQLLHNGQSNRQYVDSIYVNALGRHAEPQTKGAWDSVMQAGASRGDVMSAIALSPEGQIHFAATHG
jgi:probable HAF family extracellular repeat protein